MILPSHQKPNRSVISIGSNVGDRLNNLQRSIDLWSKVNFFDLIAISRIYESKPLGEGKFSGDFYDISIAADVFLEPIELLNTALGIENLCGRDRLEEKKSGHRNRTADCDVIFYGDKSINLPELKIPHPRWTGRDFIIESLKDLKEHLTPWQTANLQEAEKSFNYDYTPCRVAKDVINFR
ncbi:MAG TPA: 2-amino-4-hydroxy-6-hydroxymethyldihydropteridine diphosphokinase [bacterium]|jgi:2-amino-4-hydroxy-6-hydroxymethyldihydropteridine diphosphokinase